MGEFFWSGAFIIGFLLILCLFLFRINTWTSAGVWSFLICFFICTGTIVNIRQSKTTWSSGLESWSVVVHCGLNWFGLRMMMRLCTLIARHESDLIVPSHFAKPFFLKGIRLRLLGSHIQAPSWETTSNFTFILILSFWWTSIRFKCQMLCFCWRLLHQLIYFVYSVPRTSKCTRPAAPLAADLRTAISLIFSRILLLWLRILWYFRRQSILRFLLHNWNHDSGRFNG